MVDYLVYVSDDDTTETFVKNIRSAISLAKKMAKKYAKEVTIVKFRDEVPADFDVKTYWYVQPNGEVR